MSDHALDRSSSRAALVLNASLAGCLLLLWLSMAWRGLFWQADFGVFYTGWSMVLAGEGDRIVHVEQSARLHRQIAHSTLRRFSGAGHMVHQTETDKVMSAINEASKIGSQAFPSAA